MNTNTHTYTGATGRFHVKRSTSLTGFNQRSTEEEEEDPPRSGLTDDGETLPD